MSASTKLHQLESKISDLQKQHQLLLKERQQEIATLLTAVDLAHIDNKMLTGGLLFLKEKISIKDPIVEVWREAGEKFLRYTKPKTRPHQQSSEGDKRTGNCPQVVVKKELVSNKGDTPPKQAHTPQTTDQSPQEPAQPGEA